VIDRSEERKVYFLLQIVPTVQECDARNDAQRLKSRAQKKALKKLVYKNKVFVY